MSKHDARRHPVLEAIRAQRWRDPGSNRLRELLGLGLDLPDLELFATAAAMAAVKAQLAAGGYVDDPAFCMVRQTSRRGDEDARLVFDTALFIAGSVQPGDDVFVVADGSTVRVFDWRRTPTDRWVAVGSVEVLIAHLAG